MKIEYHCKYDKLVDPDKLKRHPKNSKIHPQKQIDSLCSAIRFLGWRQVVTVSNRSGFIVAGDCRRLASKQLGCQAPVVYQDFETDVDEIAYLELDNHIAELAVTDEDVLQSNLDLLDDSGFDLGDIGFDLEIDLGVSSGDGDAGSEGSSHSGDSRPALDELRVFVLPEKRKAFFGALKSFQTEHGESSVRWQKV